MRKYIILTTLILILVIGYIIASKMLKVTNNKQQSATSTPATEKLVGNDEDAHGCRISAGYSWCEAKQKCLRPWEESCDNKITPTIDESDTLKSVVKQSIQARSISDADNLNITVSTIEGNYAKGMVNEQGGGGLWLAAKIDGVWKLVWDGNGIINCNDLEPYSDFPNNLIPQCWDKMADKLIER